MSEPASARPGRNHAERIAAHTAPELRLRRWMAVLWTQNLPPGAPLDPVSKWLIITRASVLPMTLFAACIGGLLAVHAPSPRLDLWALGTLGLLLAHVANNLMNDFFDTESGVDTPGYARAQYSPHPLLSGWITRAELLAAIVLVNVLGLCVALVLTALRGWEAMAFALAGAALSVFYVAPPLRLKHHGLGEPSVFLIWGPLMIAGTYFITTGELAGWVWAASLPYGLLVTTVLFGKHIDKLPADAEKNIRTLPVLLGPRLARQVTRGMILAFYGIVGLEVLAGALPIWCLAVAAAWPRTRRVLEAFEAPPPPEPPPDYPVWPLWYVAAAFALTRRAGALLVLALLIDVFVPFSL